MTTVADMHAAFLADIVARPEDDAPRLIYADFLEEHGEPERAEFIRVQCEFERLADPDRTCPFLDNYERSPPRWAEGICQCRGCRLHRRERELLTAANALAWGPDVEAWEYGLKRPFATIFSGTELADGSEVPAGYVGTRFRRGFVEKMALPLPEWIDHGRLLRTLTPLRVVRLLGGGVRRPRGFLMRRPRGFLMRRLACDDEPGDNPICGLDTLDLSQVSIERWRLDAAMNEAYRPWRGLRHLILSNWASLGERYRGHEVEQWKKRVPSLETVTFGRSREATNV